MPTLVVEETIATKGTKMYPMGIGGHKVTRVYGVTCNSLLVTHYFFRKICNRPLLLSPFLLKDLKQPLLVNPLLLK